MRIGIRTLLPHKFYLSKVKSCISIKHFLISAILYEENTLINFVLFMKNFSFTVLMLDFIGLNVCITFCVYKILARFN